MRPFMLVIALFLTSGAFGQEPKGSEGEKSVDYLQALVGKAMPLAVRLLEKNKAFFPFGATIAADGTTAMANGWSGKEQPPAVEIIAVLKSGLQRRRWPTSRVARGES